MARAKRTPAPAWKSYPIVPRDLGVGSDIPKSWLAYVEAEDRAYHRVNGLTFTPRTEPADPGAGNPWRAYRIIPRAVKCLSGQLDAFKPGVSVGVRQWAE